MSSPLAIAGVTWLMRDLLNEGIINGQISATGDVKVTAQPPLRDPKAGTGEQSQLNLFLYHVAFNPGWRNNNLPAFDNAGARVANPLLALDLHYLLTAYDERDLHAEVLLGYAMHLLHETPVLTRKAIRKSLLNDVPMPPAPAPPTLPAGLRELTKAGLADQIEAIKITPHPTSTEEMSKLWTAFQAPYRPSVAYLVTVVLIEAARPRRAALPVLTVGEKNLGPGVQANLLPPVPTLTAVRPLNYQPVARTTESIDLLGHHLGGTQHQVVLKHRGLNLEVVVPTAGLTLLAPPTREESRDGTVSYEVPDDTLLESTGRIRVDLAQATPAADWAAGLYSVVMRVLRPGDSAPRTTNALPLAIAPAIRFDAGFEPGVTAEAAVNGFRATTVQIHCTPRVRPSQTAALIVADRELPGVVPLLATDPLQFKGQLPEAFFARVGDPPEAPQQKVRLRVDGVESVFLKRQLAPKPPEFDPTQVLTMP